MKERLCAAFLLMNGLFLPGLPRLALAEGLTVASYIDLSIARLELTKASLEQQRQPPDAASTNALWARYQTNPADYVAYRGLHGPEVDSYLAENPNLAARIDELSGALNALVEQVEKQ